MGATARPSSDFYTDGVAFAERTGRLYLWQELLQLGLEPDTMTGGFSCEKADVLLDFVRRDPAYHIVTFTSDRYMNKFVVGPNTVYFLADGDADPNLDCNQLFAPNWHLVLEDAICKTLAMIKDMKNRRQTKN